MEGFPFYAVSNTNSAFLFIQVSSSFLSYLHKKEKKH